jgi:hypothetical protein
MAIYAVNMGRIHNAHRAKTKEKKLLHSLQRTLKASDSLPSLVTSPSIGCSDRVLPHTSQLYRC